MNCYENLELLDSCGGVLRPGGLELTRRALDFCGLEPGGSVLDLGCGAGASLAFLRGLGFSAFGLDISRALLAGAAGKGPVLLAGAEVWPFKAASFNAVFCECVLSVLTERRKALAEARRCLRPGGRLIISDLCLPDGKWTEETSGGSGAGEADVPGGAARPWTEGEFAANLRQAGLKVRLQEDHRPALKEFAARLIWNCNGLPSELAQTFGGVKNLSYCLTIAEKI